MIKGHFHRYKNEDPEMNNRNKTTTDPKLAL